MRIARWLGYFSVLLVTWMCWHSSPVLAATSPSLTKADWQYQLHNYREALELYQQVQKQAAPPDKARIQLHILYCYEKLKDYDGYTTQLQSTLKQPVDNLFRSRILRHAAHMYQVMPHYGYKRNGQIYRSETHREGERVYLYSEDQAQANQYWLQARRHWEKLFTAPQQAAVIRELLDFDFEWMMFISSTLYRMDKWELGIPPTRMGQSFNEKAPPLTQYFFIYQEARLLGQQLKESQPILKADSLWIGMILAHWGYQAEKYPHKDPLEIAATDVLAYPHDPLAAELQLIRSEILINRQQFSQALELLQILVKKWPDSPMVNNAKAQIQNIQWPALNLQVRGIQPSQNRPLIHLSGRNAKNVQLQIHRVDLTKVLQPHLNKNAHHFNDFVLNFGKDLDQIRQHYGTKMMAWQFQPQVNPYHAFDKDMELDQPLPPGAYVVEAVAGEAHSAALLVISDIVLTKTSDIKKMIYFVSDADTGKPLPKAQVWLKENPYYSGNYPTKVTTTTTNEQGMVVYDPSTASGNYNYVEALVRYGDHYAITGMEYWNRYYSSSNTCKVFSSTDRPIYRPGQKVFFRHILRQYTNGSYTNLTALPVLLRIFDARGTEVYKKELKTDRFGAIHDSLQLGATPPLGRYYASLEFISADDKARLGNYLTLSGGHQFQVEEYKRPEFKVAVIPPTEPSKPGEKAQVMIKADYFFGAPVTQGTLKYRIYKKTYYPSFAPMEHPYRWLYGDMESYFRPYYYYNSDRTLLEEKTIPLSPTGQTPVAIQTADTPLDLTYDIEAEVVDASRRMVQGSGALKVTHQSYYAQILLKRGFYGPGDRVDAEVQLVDVNGRPVQTKGKLVIQTVKGQKEEQINEVSSESVTSDAEGRIFYRWTPAEQARYRLVFMGRDRYEREVKSTHDIWVVGDQFQGQYYKFQNVEILTDQRIYQPGDTVQVLLNTAFADSYILLFESAGSEILGYQLLHVPDHSRVIQLKLQKHHLPNFNLKAMLVRNRALHEDNRELFVPPAEQFLNVALKATKKEFLPGEKTRLDVDVHDHKGNPVETLLALGITDASIYDIQPDLTGDIRKYYYGERRSVQQSVSASFAQSFTSLAQVDRIRESYKTYGYTYIHGGYGGRYREADGEGFATTGTAAPEQPAPAPAAKALAKPSSEISDSDNSKDDNIRDERKLNEEQGKAGANAPAQVRSNFAETAYWNPMLVTNAQGKASLELTFPDSLTTWKINAHGITTGTAVGQTAEQVITTKKLLVRLQAPRFFTERDEVVLSANINNQYEQAQDVTAEIQLDPALLQLQSSASVKIKVAAKGEARVDWRVKVKQEGQARITMKALAASESDAVQMDFPVLVHGIDKTVMRNGVLREQNSAQETLTLPSERKPGATQLKLTLNPSLAGTLLEALPYLAEYPYGCVEQTTSRFVPAVLVAHSLQKSGISLQDLGQQRNLNADQLSVRIKNPIFDKTELDQMVQDGLKKLYQFQRSDGGWGWWYGSEHSDAYMSAYVLYALQLAAKTDYPIDANVIQRGLDFLQTEFRQESSLHLKAYQAFVLAMSQSGRIKAQDLEVLFKKRDELNHYSKALLALAYHYLGDKAKAELICNNLRSFIQVDKSNGTASIPGEQSYWWYWYGDRVETNAFVLKAYANILPKDPMVPMLVRWLVFNRESNRWTSTKDTAQVIYAMMDYLKQSGELAPDYTLTVKVNNKVVKRIPVNRQNALTFANQVVLKDADLRSGENLVQIEKQGQGALYYSAQLSYFTLEENIKASGNEIAVKREYFRVKADKSLVPIKTGEVLTSGDEIEVKLTIQSQNDYEYLIFEDRKPAGGEVIDKKSGYVYQNGVYLNRELRDTKVVFFLDDLAQGTQVLTYRMRAEIPGIFHALPHQAGAMYAPKVQAISDEALIQIKDYQPSRFPYSNRLPNYKGPKPKAIFSQSIS